MSWEEKKIFKSKDVMMGPSNGKTKRTESARYSNEGFQHMNIHAPNYQGLGDTRTWVKTLAENPCVVNVNCASKNVEIPLGGD